MLQNHGHGGHRQYCRGLQAYVAAAGSAACAAGESHGKLFQDLCSSSSSNHDPLHDGHQRVADGQSPSSQQAAASTVTTTNVFFGYLPQILPSHPGCCTASHGRHATIPTMPVEVVPANMHSDCCPILPFPHLCRRQLQVPQPPACVL